MIEIRISSDLAAAHPRFMAECAKRGRPVEVFEPRGARRETDITSERDSEQTSSARVVAGRR